MLLEGCLPARGPSRPLVVEFVDDEDAVAVAEADELPAVGVVRGADVVHAELLQEPDALLNGLGIGSGSEGAEGVVVGTALEQHLAPVEPEAEVGTELNRAESEGFCGLVGDGVVVTQQLGGEGVQIRRVDIPYLGIGDDYVGGNPHFLSAQHTVALHGDGVAVHRLPLGILYLQGDARRLFLGAVGKLGGDAHIAVVAGSDVKRVTAEEEILRGGDEADIADEPSTGVPAGVLGLAGVGNHLDQIVLAVGQMVGDVDLKAHVAVVGASDALVVQIDISGVENAFEVEDHTTAFRLFRRSVVQAVVTFGHVLETPSGERVDDAHRHTVIIGVLV